MSADGVLASVLAEAISSVRPRLVGEDRLVRDLFHDSRDVTPGSGFVAVRGSMSDGHTHVPAACTSAANLVVVDHQLDTSCPQLVVDDTRRRMAQLAATVHGQPATELTMVGITGTNGKTTVTHMIESIVAAAGGTPGIVGTTGAHIAGEVVPLARTTPEATDLHRLLRQMVDRGVTLAALEVSSHALVFGRADAVVFDVAAFTNLSQDHLDFHGTMEQYYLAKAELFTPARARHAVVWMEDPAGARLAASTGLPKTTVGFGGAGSFDVSGKIVARDHRTQELMLHVEGESMLASLPVVGTFNAANSLVAAAVVHRLGFGIDAIVAGLAGLPTVPGRFEQVPNERGISVIVDYAHTPEAVGNAIAAASEVSSRRVIAVVGSAGDRDPDKRAPMGAAAATADLAIITSDNPRSEDPLALVDQVLAGAGGTGESVIAEVDRRAAIRRALALADHGDVVLILGKGHEDYQEFADHTVPFDDRLVAAEELLSIAGETP
jgi:UDP-N-acetylmuramoyl-L-alanyl-D-glutamate--2,6-diaminopimelate ligase